MIDLNEYQMCGIAGGSGEPAEPGNDSVSKKDKTYACVSPGIFGICVTGSGEVIGNGGIQSPGWALGTVMSPNTTASDFLQGFGLAGHGPSFAGPAVSLNGADSKVGMEIGPPGGAITYGVNLGDVAKSAIEKVDNAVNHVKETAERIVQEAKNSLGGGGNNKYKDMDSDDTLENGDGNEENQDGE